MEEFWLGSTPYVGGEHISLGDLPILTELETLRLLEGAAEVCPYIFEEILAEMEMHEVFHHRQQSSI